MPIQFISPAFLWFLLLIAIPILIHLFNFRRFKKIEFTNVRFLKELKDETQSQSKLKHLLVLLARMLAIIFLVLAFARPFIPKNKTTDKGEQAVISLYIDNSFSMNSLNDQGNLLEEAKIKCHDVAEAYPATTQFQLITNDFRGEQQRLMNKEETLDNIDKIKITSFSRTASEILARQQDALAAAQGNNKTLFWFSDFQKSFLTAASDSTLTVNAVMLNAVPNNNIYIDSCWLSSPVIQPNMPVELSVRVKNTGSSEGVDVPLKFFINDVQKSVSTIHVNAESEAIAVINFTVSQTGWQKAMVSLDDNPITFDDAYYFSFRLVDKISVYHIGNGQNIFIKKLFEENSIVTYRYAAQTNVNFMELQGANAVVLTDVKEIPSGMSDELMKFVNRGGTLIVFPDSLINPTGFSMLSQKLQLDNFLNINNNTDRISKIDFEHEVFKNMFEKMQENMNLPDVIKHYDLTSDIRSNREVLLRLQGGSSFLNRYKSGKGMVYLFTAPAHISAGGFVTHALFAPILFKAALLSIPSLAPSFTLGNGDMFALTNAPSADEVVHLRNKKENIDIIPEIRSAQNETAVFMPELGVAGFYDLTNKRDSLLAVVAMNYNRNESVINFANEEELVAAFGNQKFKSFNILSKGIASVSTFIKELNNGISLWKYCIILVLLFLGIEILLLRFMK
jgi:hypothetical protein